MEIRKVIDKIKESGGNDSNTILEWFLLIYVMGEGEINKICMYAQSIQHQYNFQSLFREELQNLFQELKIVFGDEISEMTRLLFSKYEDTTVVAEILYLLQKIPNEQIKNIILNPWEILSRSRNNEFSITNSLPVNKLVCKLLKENEGKSLLNIDCGSGVFLSKAVQENIAMTIEGDCFDRENYLISCIQQQILNQGNVEIYNRKLYEKDDNKFDKIYVTYPFRVKWDESELNILFYMSKYWENIGRISRGGQLVSIINLLEELDEKGIMIALIPDGALFNHIDKKIRKFLIDYNYLDAIICLPAGIILGTGIGTSLLILKKDREEKNDITLIDATEMYYRKQRRFVDFTEENINLILDLYTNPRDVKKISKSVSIKDVIENDYNWGKELYINDLDVLVNPVTLKEVSQDIFRGYQINATGLDAIAASNFDDTNYRILNVSDIQPEGFIQSELMAVNIDDTRKMGKYCLHNGDLVITARNTSIKTAIYEDKDDKKVILTGNLIAVRLDTKKINPYYLKAFFDSEIGEISIARIQTGTSIKIITPKNLGEMLISLPDMEIQKKIAQAYQDKLKELKEVLQKYNKLSFEMKEIYELKIEKIEGN